MQGGMPGAEHLRDSPELDSLLQQHAADGKLLTAICAAPAVVFESKGLLKGKTATCHPAFTEKLSDQRWALWLHTLCFLQPVQPGQDDSPNACMERQMNLQTIEPQAMLIIPACC